MYTTAALGAVFFYLMSLNEETNKASFIPIDFSVLHTRNVIIPRNILRGTPRITSSESESESVYAVILDNTKQGRPQYGIADAPLVYEFPVEGGVTRLLAFFDDAKDIPQIGPVRSTRLYVNSLARGFGAIFAHSGGSPNGLADLVYDKEGIINIDEIGPSGKYFWRDRSSLPPYNLFTRVDLLWKAKRDFNDHGLRTVTFASAPWDWQESDRGETVTENTRVHQKVFIDYSNSAFFVEYRFNAEGKFYERYMAGKVHTDTEGNAVQVNNILVAFVDVRVIDEVGRLEVTLTGRGNAFACSNGMCSPSFWYKETNKTPLQFFTTDDYEGKEEQKIKLVPGTTWVHLVPSNRTAEYLE